MAENDNPILLPYPCSLTRSAGQHILRPRQRIILQGAVAQELLPAGRRLQAQLGELAGLDWEIAATPLGPAEEIGAVLRLAAGTADHEQGYRLTISPEQILIEAPEPAGVFYGACTLVQLVAQYGRTLPAVQIADWPDFAARGVMLDISRDKVPQMDTLYSLVDMLAGWKINQVQLYTEHTFAYRQHPDVWVEASPVTGDEILALDAFCRERFIELVPNQNTFGHMARWLNLPRYRSLAETHEEFLVMPYGHKMQGPFSLCPLDPGSLQLVRSLFDELLPHFSSKQLNVGCDETFDLGQGRSKEECERRGTERVYLDYLLQVHNEVAERGYTMQFWGDIIVQRPDLIPVLPKNSIALEWGYEADHPFEEHGEQFARSGIAFYVCPGTSAWCSIAGRTDNAIGNLRNAAEHGLKNGAIGYLNTDWGDMGHWQVLPVSFLGFAVGAAYSWALDANRAMDIPAVVSLHAFRDPTGAMGRVAYDLGNVYKSAGVLMPNSSLLFWTLQRDFAQEQAERVGGMVDYASPPAAIDKAMASIATARMQRPDAALILAEFENTARMLRHACRRGQLIYDDRERADPAATKQALDDDLRDIICEYERIWLARNRPGGLRESVGRLQSSRLDYRPEAAEHNRSRTDA
jgi:hexosaminidase